MLFLQGDSRTFVSGFQVSDEHVLQ